MTIAPELRINSEFFGRPVLRAYAIYSGWGNDFKGLAGGNAYDNDKEGYAFGLQMEAWW